MRIICISLYEIQYTDMLTNDDVLVSSAVFLGSLLRKRKAKPHVWARPFLQQCQLQTKNMEEFKINHLSGLTFF